MVNADHVQSPRRRRTRRRAARAAVTTVALTTTIGLVGIAPAGAVVGGTKSPRPYSFMVSVQAPADASRTNPTGHFCGATLIDAEWAVTAAHCLFDETDSVISPRRLRLRVGSRSLDAGGEVVGVREVIVHPGFLPAVLSDTYNMDIGLLRLARPVESTPIAIDKGTMALPARVRLLGWGVTSPNSVTPTLRLRQLDTFRQPASACAGIAAKELCVKNPARRTSACSGDSGGPLIRRSGESWRLLGATSRPETNGAFCRSGTIYTDVRSFRRWISQTIEARREAGEERSSPAGVM